MTLTEYLIASGILFGIGAFGVLFRRNLLIVLMSLELMLNAVNLAALGVGLTTGALAGPALVLLVLAVAAAEVTIGMALVINLVRLKDSADLNLFKLLRG